MDVILLERIEKLGQMGDTVKVKPGFARNYLLPQKKALRATKENQARFETQRVQLEAQNLQRREEAQAVAAKLNGLSILIIRQAGEGGMLYGSVSGRDVADAVKEAGFTVERRQVSLDNPIKSIGVSQVRVSLHPEVAVSVNVTVARSREEAERAASRAAAEATPSVVEEELEVEVDGIEDSADAFEADASEA
jgi:large subunit ribosomal protein L9